MGKVIHDTTTSPSTESYLAPPPAELPIDDLAWVDYLDPESVDAEIALHEWLDEMAAAEFFDPTPLAYDRWPTDAEVDPKELNAWLWTEYGLSDNERESNR